MGLVEIDRSRACVSVDKVHIIYCNIVSSGKIKYASRQNLIKLPTRDVVLVIYSGTRLMVTSRRRCSKSECPNTNRSGSPRVGNNNIACRCVCVCVEGVNRPETKKNVGNHGKLAGN